MAPSSRSARLARPARFAALSALALVAACGADSADSPAAATGWQGERTARGDTTIVRTVAGSEWGSPRDALVDLEIGVLDGPDELMFGSVGWLLPDRSGGVYVFDGRAPAIRRFDATGAYLGQIGGPGEGPGEYSNMVLGHALRSDGRLQIMDARQARIAVYDPEGSFALGWPFTGGFFTNEMMFVDSRDHTYVKNVDRSRIDESPTPRILIEHDASGAVVDTLPEPRVADEPEPEMTSLAPSKQWTMAPDGSWLVGSNADYSFERQGRDGTVLRIERVHEARAVTPDEHAAYEEANAWMVENQGQFMASLPAETPWVKPHFRSLHAGRDGTLWVRLYGPVTPIDDEPDASAEDGQRPPSFPFREAAVYDVFAPDGTYLGEVRAPARTTISSFGLDELWGVRQGEFGEAYVVRLALAGGEA